MAAQEDKSDGKLGRIALKQVRMTRAEAEARRRATKKAKAAPEDDSGDEAPSASESSSGKRANPMNMLVPYLDLFARLGDDELARMAKVDEQVVTNMRTQIDQVHDALEKYADLLTRLGDQELVLLTGANPKTIRFWRLSQPWAAEPPKGVVPRRRPEAEPEPAANSGSRPVVHADPPSAVSAPAASAPSSAPAAPSAVPAPQPMHHTPPPPSAPAVPTQQPMHHTPPPGVAAQAQPMHGGPGYGPPGAPMHPGPTPVPQQYTPTPAPQHHTPVPTPQPMQHTPPPIGMPNLAAGPRVDPAASQSSAEMSLASIQGAPFPGFDDHAPEARGQAPPGSEESGLSAISIGMFDDPQPGPPPPPGPPLPPGPPPGASSSSMTGQVVEEEELDEFDFVDDDDDDFF